MAKPTIADLQAVIAGLTVQVQTAEGRAATLETDRNTLKAQNDALRDEAYSSNMELARMRGYIEGMADAEPPRMVPEPREHPLAKFRDTSNDASVRSWTDKRRWYHAN